MSFQPIRRILPFSVRKAGLEEPVTAARIVLEAEAALTRLAGSEQAAFTDVVSVSDGVLKVIVRSPSASHMLKTIETPLLNEINRALGDRKIRALRIERSGF
jgi:hypothetical protein